MRNPSITAAFILLASYAANTPAATVDQNGYAAQYECRAGNPNCNVDVAGLGNRTCDQTITSSDPSWSKINWSNNTICLQAGDHTSKGTLTIPSTANGSATNYKVLRYLNNPDNNEDPWKQALAARAQVEKLIINGSNWIIHRLTFPSIDRALHNRLQIHGSARDVIVSRVLVEGMSRGFSNGYTGIQVECCSAQRITIQNSVVRNSWGKLGAEPHGIWPLAGEGIRIVNNEVYNWSAHPIQLGRNEIPAMPGFVVENNDIYADSSMHLPGGKARAKAPLTIKARATASNIGRVMQNRISGGRRQDAKSCCIVASGGHAMSIMVGSGNTYTLVQNNVIMWSQVGLGIYINSTHNLSIVGNIFHKMDRYDVTTSSHALEPAPSMENSEVYLNSFIDNGQYGFSFNGGAIDIKCNAFIAGGAREGGTPGSSTHADHNVFYGTPSWSFNGTGNNIDKPILTRTNSTNYTAGTAARWSDPKNCSATTDTGCYLYMARNSGTSLGSEPKPCTTLGCAFDDGSITWQAIRGPYAFYRKLRTTPEIYVIPYALPYADASDSASKAPEAYACPSDFAARRGMGINDGN